MTHYFHHNSLVKRQTDDSVKAFLDAIADMPLTLAEKLQIINLCPTSLVELYLSVDEVEIRLGSAEKAHELLGIINSTLYVEESAEQPKEHETPTKLVLTERAPRPSLGKGHGKNFRGGKGKHRGRGGHGGPKS